MASTRTPNRAPLERRRDADRSRRRLLDAALDEFSAKGFAGARVSDIAERAGVNRQLITYYFGGKDGLYAAVQSPWFAHAATIDAPALGLAEQVTRYLHDALADPRRLRLMAWRGLAATDDQPPDAAPEREDLTRLRARQALGEVAADLEPEAVLLLLMSAVTAPVVMPQLVRRIFGLEPDDPEFERRYTDQLHRMIARLADPSRPHVPGHGARA